MPNRPVQHEIDELAQRAFRNALPPAWIINEFTNDYAKDYHVEVVSAGSVTGDIFVVQLKGKREKQRRKGAEFFSVPIQREHLRYYYDLLRIPVFVVAVDVVTGEAFFEFAQALADEDSAIRLQLHKPGRATLRISRNKPLSNTELVLRELARAWEYLGARNPGAVEAAVRHRRATLKKLDSRFDYDISLNNGKEHIAIRAATPVDCRLVLEGDPEVAARQMAAFINEGSPLEANGQVAIRVEGSPIFEQQKLVRIESKQAIPVEVRLFATAAGGVPSYFPEFRGDLTGGVRKRFFIGKLAGSPLELGLILESVEDAGLKINLQWRWLPERWAGQPVRRLSWFEPIRAFFCAASQPDAVLGIELSSNGQKILEHTLAREQTGKISSILGYVELLNKARHISEVLNLDTNVPTQWQDVDFQDIEELHSLLTTGYYEFPGRMNFSATLSDVSEKSLAEFNATRVGVFGLSPNSPFPYTVLGTSFDFAEVRHEYIDMKRATIRKAKGGKDGVYRIELRSAKRRYVWARYVEEPAISR